MYSKWGHAPHFLFFFILTTLVSYADDITPEAEEGHVTALSEAIAEGTGNGDYLIEEGRTDNHTTDNDGLAYGRRGREYAALDATALAAHGKNTANATGAKLVSIAIPKIMSRVPKLVWEGMIQLGYARREFAQSNADREVQGRNQAQRDLLTANANQGGQQAKTAEEDNPLVKQLTESMGGLLALNGINADNFVNDLLGDKFKSDEEMLRAMDLQEPEKPADARDPIVIAKEVVRSGQLTITKIDDYENATAKKGKGTAKAPSERAEQGAAKNNGGSPERIVSAAAAGRRAMPSQAPTISRATKVDITRTISQVRPLATLSAGELRAKGVLKIKGDRAVFHIARMSYQSFARHRLAPNIPRLYTNDVPRNRTCSAGIRLSSPTREPAPCDLRFAEAVDFTPIIYCLVGASMPLLLKVAPCHHELSQGTR